MSGFADGVQAIESLLTALAILAAGVWTYLRFLRNRQRLPRVRLETSIHQRPIREGTCFLRVSVRIINQGEVLLPLTNGFTLLQRVRPWPEAVLGHRVGEPQPAEGSRHKPEISWPEVAKISCEWDKGVWEIEPKDHETFHFDFIVDSAIETLNVYSYFQNDRKTDRTKDRKIGWSNNVLHDVESVQPGRSGESLDRVRNDDGKES